MKDVQKSDLAAIEALRKKGYKATPQRIAICRFALHSRDHPTARRIYNEVKKVHPTVSLATVYKTLQVPKGQARFDSYMKPHINLFCLQCGNIKDLDDLTTREIVERVATTTKFTATGQRLDVYGICQKCGGTKIVASSIYRKHTLK
jgi:Fur family peroxide stress response transcriptional regulator